jgi:hypothetical protein
MKVITISNGTKRLVLIPENDSERADLELISKQETQKLLTDKTLSVIDQVIPEGSLIIQSSKILGNNQGK